MKGPGESLSTLSPRRSKPPAELAPGARVDRFVLEEVLGRGGAGVVHAAFDPRLGRRVAVKLLINAGSSASRARLLREARSMARLAHPNVAVVFDAGEHGDQLFVAMELVDGTSLDRWLKERTLGWREILELFLAAGRGLAAAHAAGIIHRDFKPANVLVGRDGRPRVSDFGLARGDDELGRSADASLPDVTSDEVTRSGTILGTPAYMPPEQHRGDPASPQSDQYSFCVALWEALYRKRPGPQPIAVPRGPVPVAIRRALLRGLSAEADARWPSMEALLATLSAAARRRGRLVAALAGLVLVGSLAGVVTARRLAPGAPGCAGQEHRLRGVWDAGRKAAMEKAFLATGLPYAAARFATVAELLDRDAARSVTRAEALCRLRPQLAVDDAAGRAACLDQHLESLRAWVDVFSTVDARRVQTAAGLAAARDEVDACEEPAVHARPTPADPALAARVAELRVELERLVVRKHIGETRQATEGLAQLEQAARAAGYPPFVSEVLAWYSESLLDMGEVALAARLLTERLALAEETRDDHARGASWAFKVSVLATQRRFAEAHETARYALAVLAPMTGPDAEAMRLGVLRYDGDAYWYEHERGTALMLETAALVRAEKLRGPGSIRLVPYLVDEGQNLDYLGDFEGAERMYRRALELVEKVNGSQNAQASVLMANIETLHSHRGDLDQALSWGLRTQEAMEAGFGAGHLFPAEHQVNLAQTYLQLGNVHEALERLGRAGPVMEAKLAPQAPELAELRATLGSAQLAAGQPALAVAALEAALAAQLANKASPDELAPVRFDLARALWALRADRPRARRLAAEALAGFPATKAKEHQEVERFLAAAQRR